jgi:membrane-associated phospholipid phosphatase
VSARDLDHRLLVLARTRGHTAARDRTVARFSHAGEHGACWLVLGAAGAVVAGPGEQRAQWLRGVRLVAAAYGLNTTVKLAVRRPRPTLAGLPALTATLTRLSFPSAHATTGFAAARFYATLVPAAPLYALATTLAASRLYLGVHYPSDVVAGAALGTVLARPTGGRSRWR